VDSAVLAEQERIGIARGGQIVFLPVVLLGIQEGQLGQREEAIRADSDSVTPKLGEHGHRIVVEAVGEPEAMKSLRGRAAGLSAVEDAPRDQATAAVKVGERDAERRGVARRKEKDADQRGERESLT